MLEKNIYEIPTRHDRMLGETKFLQSQTFYIIVVRNKSVIKIKRILRENVHTFCLKKNYNQVSVLQKPDVIV